MEHHVAPRTLTEEILADLWGRSLGAERTGGRIGIHDDFFALGGGSLLAARLMEEVCGAFRVELPPRVLFERSTLVEMAWAVEEAILSEGAGGTVREASPAEPEEGPAVLSFSQERLWLLEQIDPDTAAYNIPGALRLRGLLDVAALRQGIAEIVRRHDVLRTRFLMEEGRPVQRVEPSGFDLPLVDLAALPGAARSGEVRRLTREEVTRPFDLAAGPPFRATLLRLDPGEHVALYTMHHIVSDGWSLDVFFRETATLYAAFAAGRPSPLRPLPLQYAGFARRQRARLTGPRLEEGLAAWRRLLDGVAALELPADRPRPAARSWRGTSVPVTLGPAVSERLAALAREERATLFMALLALWQTFLHRLARQDDIAVGTAVANRTDRDTADLIGCFVNSVVLRTDLSGDPPLREVLRHARRTALEAFQLQEIPFEKVVEALQPERHSSRTPLFQAMLTLQNTPQRARPLAGLDLEPVEASRETAKFDLSLGFTETPYGLAGLLEFDLDLFDPATAERWARHLTTLIEAAVAAPDRRIFELPLLTEPESRQLVALGSPSAAPRGLRSLPRLFEEQVDRAPDAVALSADGFALSYRELDARAGRLALWLMRQGVVPGGRVALRLDRSPELVVALLAVLKTGAAYVPLDPSAPEERLAFALEDSGASLVLDRGLVERELDRADRTEPSDRTDRIDPEMPAYVIYTSGSTGRPKGVVISHGNVARLFAATELWFGFGPGDVWTLFHSYAFDFSVWEMWGGLLYGGRLVVVPYWVSREPEAFWRLLGEERVTVLNQTPSAFRQLIQANGEHSLRWIIFGGEALDPTALTPWLDRYGDERPRLVNMYGITETTVHVTFRRLLRENARRPASLVGAPIPDLSVHVLDRHLQVQPLGVPGEICVGGAGLAQGYLGRPDLTAERFVPDPFGDRSEGARLYRSGDLARRRPDGDLEYLGRLDQQVKIRGFRIEPGDIEAALARHPAVRGAVVLVRGEGEEKRLVGYVASDRFDGSDLRRWLAGKLPEHMVPSDFVVLERLPLTVNGKVDRRALAQIAPERSADGFVAPRTLLEEIVAGLFVEVLGAERTGGRAGAHDSFFELGGHSLAATRLVSRLRAALGVELPLRAVFEAPTVAALAVRCGASEVAERGSEIPLVAAPRDPAGEPLSFAQERLWFLDRLASGTSVYNLPSRLRLRGPLDVARLAGCFSEVVRRHEGLRTRFVLRDETPVQVVDPPGPFVLPVVDLTGLPEALRRPEAERQVAVEAELPFDLQRGPLLRVVLVRLSVKKHAEEHATILSVHHIVSDGWSMGILFGEVGALYRGESLPGLPVQVADVARWQRQILSGPALEAQLAYWRDRLAGAPPSLDLPLDRVRPAVQTYRGGMVLDSLSPELADRLRSLAHREGASLFMVLLAGFSVLLGRLSGQGDVVVGSPAAGRTRPELERLIGLFLNLLALRVGWTGATGRELVRQVRETALGAYAHQEVPFEKLLEELQPERDLSRPPLFQVMLNMLSFPAGGAQMPDGLVLEPLDNSAAVGSKLDLTIYASEGEHGITLEAVYNAGLFDRARIEEMLGQLRLLLEQIAADPDAPVESLSLLTPEKTAKDEV